MLRRYRPKGDVQYESGDFRDTSLLVSEHFGTDIIEPKRYEPFCKKRAKSRQITVLTSQRVIITNQQANSTHSLTALMMCLSVGSKVDHIALGTGLTRATVTRVTYSAKQTGLYQIRLWYSRWTNKKNLLSFCARA